MKVLIIRTDIDETKNSRSMGGIDSAMTLEMYYKYNALLGLTANHNYSKYTFIDEKSAYIGTFNTMTDLMQKHEFMGNVLIVTHEQWLNKQNPEWRVCPRYQYY